MARRRWAKCPTCGKTLPKVPKGLCPCAPGVIKSGAATHYRMKYWEWYWLQRMTEFHLVRAAGAEYVGEEDL